MSEFGKKFPEALNFFEGNEFAASTFINKYALRDKEGNILEKDPNQTIERVMRVLADAMPEEKTIDAFFDENGNPTCKLSRPSEEFLKRIYKDKYNEFLLSSSKGVGTWFDIFVEANSKFKRVCPQGSILAAAGNKYFPQSFSNCFVVPPPQDSIAGIMRSNEQMAQVFKRRGGAGIDLSTLRPDTALVNNAALKSSGAVGWANHFSNTCRDVAQKGRRGASMLSLHIKHPDSPKWATMKNDLTYCTGANISLWITDEFMHAVKNDKDFTLQYPIEGLPIYTPTIIKARELWKTICTSAWSSAEPGLLMRDTIERNLPANQYEELKLAGVNPCLPKWAVVLTKNGIKTIDQLRIGESIWSKEGWTRVLNKFSTGIKEVYAYKTKYSTFYGTKNHEVLEGDKKVEIQNAFSVDMCLPAIDINSLEIYPEVVMDGLMLGDGTWHEASGRAFLCIGEKDYDYFDSEIKNLIVKQSKAGDSYYDVKHSLTKEEIPKTYVRKIPERYFYGQVNTVCSFLRGLFSANGSVLGKCKRVTLKSASIEIIRQAQTMLLSIGIRSYITTNKSKVVEFSNGAYKCRQSYDLNISRDREKFYNYIGFLQKYKNKKLGDYIKTKTTNSGNIQLNTVTSSELISTEEVFDITVDNNSHTFWNNGLSISNCSELNLGAFETCRLATSCLTGYVNKEFTDDAYFDFELFEKDIRIATRMLDAVVTAEIEYADFVINKLKEEQKNSTEPSLFDVELDLWSNVKQKAIQGRRIGLGCHGLADCLCRLCLKYDSEQAMKMVEKIYSFLCNTSYDESVEMAKEYGSFPIFDWEKTSKCDFIKRLPLGLQNKIKTHGMRNASILTSAPTGSISILSQCSSGIEPTFRQVYLRRRKINANDPDSRVDFIDAVGDKWQNFPQFEYNVKKYFAIRGMEVPENINSDKDLDKYLPEYFVTSDKIDWKKRIELQSKAQLFIDNSISSTINLPKEATVETVQELYELAWEKGLKGITIYREGSRDGVLISTEEQKKDIKGVQRVEAPKRPDKLPCDVHFTSVKGVEYVVVVGLLNGSVYEVFCGKYNKQIPKKHFSGFVEKKGKSKYLLSYIDDIDFKQININEYFDNKDYAAATRLLSMSLRHGVPLEYVFEQLQKSSASIVEFGAAVSRVLKKYIKIEDLKNLYKTCPNCGSTNITIDHKDGCVSIQCFDCNTFDSKCG